MLLGLLRRHSSGSSLWQAKTKIRRWADGVSGASFAQRRIFYGVIYMKNKKLKCIISLLLALVLLVSMPLDITANAFAIETAWVTYALITFMAAMGITFTVSGGVQALENAVNNAWDECWGEEADAQRAHLCEIITFKAPSEPPSSGEGPPDPIETAYIFGSAACALIMKFVEWLKENKGWNNGEVVTGEYLGYYWNSSLGSVYINGVDTPIQMTLSDGNVISHTSSTTITLYENCDVGTKLYPGDIITPYSKSTYNSLEITSDLKFKSGDFFTSDDYTYAYGSKNTNFTSTLNSLGYSESDIAYYTFVCINYKVSGASWKGLGIAPVLKDGNVLVETIATKQLMVNNGTTSGFPYTKIYDSDFLIEIPDEPIEFDIDDTKAVELDFSVFTTADNITSPETLGDAIKQTINDTGTVPELSPSIELLPTPAPTPIVPIPENPPELEDIEDLGLPSLGQALFSKFPFCIPNDLRNVFLILKAEPETPYWEVNLTGEALGIDSNFVIDFSEYEIVGQMSRWGSIISFCLFLIINTKRLIGW